MKITPRNFTRAARCATRMAIRFLERRQLVGESNRARVMADSWASHAEEILGQANWKAIQSAPALTVCRQLATAVKIQILKAEVATHRGQ